MRRGRGTLAALLLLGGLFRTTAAAASTRYALYPLGGLALGPAEVARVERALVAALAVVPDVRMVERKAVERALAERRHARLALCEGELPCLAAVGKTLGVERVVAGDAGGLGSGFVVYLRVVDVGSGREVASASAVLRGDDRGLFASARAAAFRLLAPDRYQGRLAVNADVPGAQLFVDGQRVARLPAPPVSLPVGQHAVRVTHEAYRDFLHFVDVQFDRTTEVTANLTLFPVVSDHMRKAGDAGPVGEVEEGRAWYRRWWAVAAFGVIVAGATTALVAATVDRVDADYRTHVAPPAR
jgi:hypothetical protein